jgi:ribonucleoside-diphosphate reductase beta chain
MAGKANGMEQALVRMASEDPELAAGLLVTALPAAASGIPGRLDYGLEIDRMGEYQVSIADGAATVTPADGSQNGAPERQPEFVLRTDTETLARLAAGANPIRLMLGRRLRISGKRRKALKLRRLAGNLSMRDVARAGIEPDPDLVYRALPYAIDPEWTRGHRFTIAYEMQMEGDEAARAWYVGVADGTVRVTTEPPAGEPDSTVIFSHATWLRLVRGDVSPNDAMRSQLVRVKGKMFPVTILGRWIERSEGRDDRELEREQRQREVQRTRLTWGAGRNGAVPEGQGDPGAQSKRNGSRGKRGAKRGPALLSYEELYALWERQNWKAHEIDFSVDKEHWLATPTEGQYDTMWSLSSFYIGEERVAADLAPFVMAAPTGEAEIFLATQLVDEARHAAFFDRFMAEVMALGPDDTRGRLGEMEKLMLPAWRRVFDDELRAVARRLTERPDDFDLFVEGIVIYHLVIEGVLAMTGQHQILRYLEDHDIYPGFRQGFSLVEQDEHRHIAFGVRFLSDACERDPGYRDLITQKISELVPIACHVFVPPGTEDPSDFMSYDYHSSEIYGFAYRALKRRLAVIGVEAPPPDELMPGPIDRPGMVPA